jgi:hypothetical protein
LISGNIEPAIGRSGARLEQGVKASGLLGEVYNNGDDPRRNNFVQRSWMYNDDRSLAYKRDGAPEASAVTHLSIPIGLQESGKNKTFDEKMIELNVDHRSKSTGLQFNSLNKSGYKIFQDDDDAPDENLKYHYKLSADRTVSDQTWEWKDN